MVTRCVWHRFNVLYTLLTTVIFLEGRLITFIKSKNIFTFIWYIVNLCLHLSIINN